MHHNSFHCYTIFIVLFTSFESDHTVQETSFEEDARDVVSALTKRWHDYTTDEFGMDHLTTIQISIVLLRRCSKLGAAPDSDDDSSPTKAQYKVSVGIDGIAILPEYNLALKQKELQGMVREFVAWHWRTYLLYIVCM